MRRGPARHVASGWALAIAIFVAMLAASAPAFSAEPATAPRAAAVESWVGAEATRDVWSIYSGLVWSPLGGIREDGVRLRLSSGYGQYRYDTSLRGTSFRVNGRSSFGDLMAGYYLGLGDLTLKVYAGANIDQQILLPYDPGNPASGLVYGAKGALEAWLNLSPQAWAALDVNGGKAFSSYYSRARIGYRIQPALSLGVEGGAFGNVASDNGRAGGFLRYEQPDMEVSLSGGVTGDIARPSTPYISLVYLSRF